MSVEKPQLRELHRMSDTYVPDNLAKLLRTRVLGTAIIGVCLIAAIVGMISEIFRTMQQAADHFAPIGTYLILGELIAGFILIAATYVWLHEKAHEVAYRAFGAPNVSISPSEKRTWPFRRPSFWICRAPDFPLDRRSAFWVAVAPRHSVSRRLRSVSPR